MENIYLDIGWNKNIPSSITPQYNRIADNLRKDFVNFIKTLSIPFGDNLDWWISGPTSRNTLTNPLYHYCCSLVLIKNLIKQDEFFYDGVTVDSLALYHILQEWFSKNNIKKNVIYIKNKKDRIKDRLSWFRIDQSNE